MQKMIIATLILLSFSACKNKSDNSIKPDLVSINLDTTISPSQDFFEYANGGWIKNNPIPAEQSSWGIANLVIEENMKRLREISDKAAASNDKAGSSNQMIGDFWSTAMDTLKIEKEGLNPIKPLLEKINAIKDVKILVTTVAELKKIGSSTLFDDGVGQDAKNSEVMAYQ